MIRALCQSLAANWDTIQREMPCAHVIDTRSSADQIAFELAWRNANNRFRWELDSAARRHAAAVRLIRWEYMGHD